MLRSEYPQLLHIVFKHQLFLDTLIASTERLDFRVSKCLLVHIFTLSCRSLARHDLTDKPLLVLQSLVAVRIERAFCDIAEDLNILVLIALTDNSSGALLKVSRSPRNIEVMDGNKPLLFVSACTHLGG